MLRHGVPTRAVKSHLNSRMLERLNVSGRWLKAEPSERASSGLGIKRPSYAPSMHLESCIRLPVREWEIQCR